MGGSLWDLHSGSLWHISSESYSLYGYLDEGIFQEIVKPTKTNINRYPGLSLQTVPEWRYLKRSQFLKKGFYKYKCYNYYRTPARRQVPEPGCVSDELIRCQPCLAEAC